MILASVQTGQASYPLSTGHLHETWKRRRADSRLPLARTMALISKHHAIAPPWQLLPAELDRALQARFGRPAHPLALQPFGRGLAHLSGAKAPTLDRDLVKALRELHPVLTDQDITDVIDALLFAGPDADLPFGDIGLPPLHVAEAFAEAQQAQLNLFADSDQDERRQLCRRSCCATSSSHSAKQPCAPA